MNAAQRALLLIGSPKGDRSTSASLGTYLLGRLAERGLRTDPLHIHSALRSAEGRAKLLEAAEGADILVLAFPLYVDSLPAPTIAALELIAERRRQAGPARGQRLLAIANSGFPEARQNDTALAICRRFAREAGFEWAGGLALGAGAAISGQPLPERGGMVRNVTQALDLAAAALAERRPLPQEAVDLMARPFIPAWMYTLSGGLGWKQQARRNGVQKRLRDRPYQQE